MSFTTLLQRSGVHAVLLVLLSLTSLDASAQVRAWLDRDRVAIVLDGERFVGLITRTDLINHLSLNR